MRSPKSVNSSFFVGGLDARHGRIQVAIAIEMERFSRAESLFDWLVIKQAFRQSKVQFGTPAQLYDPADTEDDFLTDLFGALAKREKRKIIERTSRGRVEAARRGRFVAANAPYGYHRIKDGQLAAFEPEAEAVRFMFEQLATGRSLFAIVDDLNARGFRPRRASRSTKGSVWGILRNPIYGGTAYYQRTRKTDLAGWRRTPRPESEWIAIPVPRPVADDLVRSTRDRLRENARMAARNQRHFWLLKGLVFCGVCGHLMGDKLAGKGLRYYACQSTRVRVRGLKSRCQWHAVSAAALDAWVWEQIVRALQAPEIVLEEARRDQEARMGERDVMAMRLAYLDKAIQHLPYELERAQTLYREGYATLEELKAQLAAADLKRDALNDERKHLQERLGTQTVDEVQAIRLEQVLARVRGRLNRLTPQEQFEAIHAVVGRIVVHSDRRIEIEACVPLVTRTAVPPAYVRTSMVAASEIW